MSCSFLLRCRNGDDGYKNQELFFMCVSFSSAVTEKKGGRSKKERLNDNEHHHETVTLSFSRWNTGHFENNITFFEHLCWHSCDHAEAFLQPFGTCPASHFLFSAFHSMSLLLQSDRHNNVFLSPAALSRGRDRVEDRKRFKQTLRWWKWHLHPSHLNL